MFRYAIGLLLISTFFVSAETKKVEMRSKPIAYLNMFGWVGLERALIGFFLRRNQATAMVLRSAIALHLAAQAVL